MLFKKSTILKLTFRCKVLEVKNKNNLIEIKSLSFAANSAIYNLSAQSSY